MMRSSAHISISRRQSSSMDMLGDDCANTSKRTAQTAHAARKHGAPPPCYRPLNRKPMAQNKKHCTRKSRRFLFVRILYFLVSTHPPSFLLLQKLLRGTVHTLLFRPSVRHSFRDGDHRLAESAGWRRRRPSRAVFPACQIEMWVHNHCPSALDRDAEIDNQTHEVTWSSEEINLQTISESHFLRRDRTSLSHGSYQF